MGPDDVIGFDRDMDGQVRVRPKQFRETAQGHCSPEVPADVEGRMLESSQNATGFRWLANRLGDPSE